MPATPAVQGGVSIASVAVTAAPAIKPEIATRLKAAIEAEAAKRQAGPTPVSIDVHVKEIDIVSGGARFFAGMLAGSNNMTVSVRAVDAANKPAASFDVERSSNPGGYGAFYDQEQATIEETAKGVLDGLGMKAR